MFWDSAPPLPLPFWPLLGLPVFYPKIRFYLGAPAYPSPSVEAPESLALLVYLSFCTWQCSHQSSFYIPLRMTYSYVFSLGSRTEERPRVWEQTHRFNMYRIPHHIAFPIRTRVWSHLCLCQAHNRCSGNAASDGVNADLVFWL